MKEIIDVILVDDHEVVRLGLMTLLEDVSWIRVVAEAGSADEAIQVVAQYKPDVVVMDIRMPGSSGLDACRQITKQWPETSVIMLTSFMDDELIFQAIQAGASGYILKQVGNESLLDALGAVRRGEALLDPAVTQRVLKRVRESESDRQVAAFRDLSDRELEVLAQVAEGKSNGDIAEALNLSEKTVRNHVSSILSKLALSNRIEAATYAVRNNLNQHLPG
jgi:DNA-binding NarL/FixJ family response regulator